MITYISEIVAISVCLRKCDIWFIVLSCLKHHTWSQCWLNACPPSAALAQHSSNICSMSRDCWSEWCTDVGFWLSILKKTTSEIAALKGKGVKTFESSFLHKRLQKFSSTKSRSKPIQQTWSSNPTLPQCCADVCYVGTTLGQRWSIFSASLSGPSSDGGRYRTLDWLSIDLQRTGHVRPRLPSLRQIYWTHHRAC